MVTLPASSFRFPATRYAIAAIIIPDNKRRKAPEQQETTMTKDPVCGMMIDESTAAGKSEYQGQTYYFCAAICKTKFDSDPGRYVGNDR